MPSIAELCKLYQKKDTVNNALEKISGDAKLKTGTTDYYWSSSQLESFAGQAWAVNFEAGTLHTSSKFVGYSVCVIHQF